MNSKLIISDEYNDGYKLIKYPKQSAIGVFLMERGFALLSILLFAPIGIPMFVIGYIILKISNPLGEIYINDKGFKVGQNGNFHEFSNISGFKSCLNGDITKTNPFIEILFKDGGSFKISRLKNENIRDALTRILVKKDF